MLKNFFLLTFRNYSKNKAFVVINVLGLGIALACCIVAYFNYKFDADFNKMHTNREKIYIVNISRYIKDRLQDYGISPISLAPAMATDISGIERLARYSKSQSAMRWEGKNKDFKILKVQIGFADKDFLRMFTFPMVLGDVSAFDDKSKILLSEATAKKYFGNKNPIGEALTIFNNEGKSSVLTVGGVFKEIPRNSIVSFEALTLFSNYLSIYDVNESNWKEWTGGTFLQVTNREQIPVIEKLLARYKEIQNRGKEDWHIEKFQIRSLDEFTEKSIDLWANWIGFTDNPVAIVAPLIMAVLILLLACFNFINTAVAASNRRLKEIGIRKVVGSKQSSLVFQFLGENFIICILAAIVSLVVSYDLFMEWNKMWSGSTLGQGYIFEPSLWIFLVLILLVTTLLSALYPAIYISSFKPLQVLRGTVKFSGSGLLSRILLVLQFSISLIGLISSIVFTQNAVFQRNFDLGYNKNQIIILQTGTGSNLEALQKTLSRNPEVLDVVSTCNHIFWGGLMRTAIYVDKKAEVQMLSTSTNYCKVMDLKILEGREFTPEFETSDNKHTAIVNETFVKELGLTDAIGKTFKIDTSDIQIIGIVKDFYLNLWAPLLPVVMLKSPKEDMGMLIVKGKKGNVAELNNQIKKEWERLIPNAPYDATLQENADEQSDAINSNVIKIFVFLSVVSVFLSIIALYTLISLNIIKRTKEIGIRKILGAPSIHINNIVGRPFFIMLFIAFVLGGAGGYYLSDMLLDNIWKQHITVNIYSILIPILIMLLLAFITLTALVYNTLAKNPIKSLRYE